MLDYPHGIILVTGPTGSGKSTSLNAFLRQINSTDLRIITIEDPIEYEVPGVNQMQVRPEIGLTFASALRHVLRQDPDVIMVGEIRDRDTAEIAIRASLTGHLVFSHPPHQRRARAPSPGWSTWAIEPFLVASAIELVIAQRLVRRLCPECARPEPVNKTKLREHAGHPRLRPRGGRPRHHASWRRSAATAAAARGYRGRIGLFEIFRLNEEMHDLILKRESQRACSTSAPATTACSPSSSGWEKVKSGDTTLEEVLRVITVTEK